MKSSSYKHLTCSILVGLVWCFASPLAAASVKWSADLQPDNSSFSYNGTGGDVWNVLQVAHYSTETTNPSWALADSDGNFMGVSFSITGTISSFNGNGFAGGDNPIGGDYFLWINPGGGGGGGGGKGGGEEVADAPVPIPDDDGGEIDALSQTINFAFSGLMPNAQYNLTFYGGSEFSDRDFSVTVGGDGPHTVPNETWSTVPSGQFHWPPSLMLTVTADGAGVISGTATPNGTEANWSGFQLALVGGSEIPEPSSIALAALAIAVVLAVRSRIA